MDNNFYYQNNMYNPGFMGGAMYAAPQPKPIMTNPLTDEERASLKLDNSFSLQVTPAEMAEAICTHKDPTKGEFSIVPNNDAEHTCTCKICHTTFAPDKVNAEYVNKAVEEMLNVLETCKYLAVDLNPEVIRGYFQMIPFIKKVPQLYKLAHNSFCKYNQVNPVTGYDNSPNYYTAFQALMNPAVPLGGYAAPGYGYGYAAPGYGYPTATQMQAAQAVPGGNPFYAQPAPAAPYQQPVPQQPVAPQPQAPASTAMNPPTYQQPAPAANTVTVTETVQL